MLNSKYDSKYKQVKDNKFNSLAITNSHSHHFLTGEKGGDFKGSTFRGDLK